MARKYTGSGGYEQPWLEQMTFDRFSQPQAHRLVICKKLRVDHVAMSAAVYSCAKARLALPGDEPSGVVASADSCRTRKAAIGIGTPSAPPSPKAAAPTVL